MGEERSVAAQLRRAREEQEKTLEQAHQQTGLSLHVLQSLEAGDFAVVEPVYVRLALRAYAEYLGLETVRMVQQFDGTCSTPASPPARITPPRKRSWARWLARHAGKP
jgi:cytoskeletal protein RodZ